MKRLTWLASLLLGLLVATATLAQTPGNFQANTPLSSAQLNATFGSKADAVNGTLTNPTIPGGLSVSNGGTGITTAPPDGDCLVGFGGVWTVNACASLPSAPAGYLIANATGSTGQVSAVSPTSWMGEAFGGVTGSMLIFNGSIWTTAVPNGDCTVTGTLVFTCTKTANTAFAPSATINTTNASNITSGTLSLSLLPTFSANAVLGSTIAATPSQLAVPSCSGSSQALNWSSGVGFGCIALSVASGTQTTAPSDSGYAIAITDQNVTSSTTAFTAPRTYTLPQASVVGAGYTLSVFDGGGAINGANTLSVSPSVGDTINFSSSAIVLTKQYQALVLESNGATKNWTVKGNALIGPIAPVSHNYLTGISSTGTWSSAQPTVSDLQAIGADTYLGAIASGSPSALSFPSCSATGQALNYTPGTGLGCAPTGEPAGSAGQIQYQVNSTTFGGFDMSGDCTLVTSTGVITCTETSGVLFAASATSDTTNATNITSGVLSLSRLPALAANQLLGSLTAVSPSGLSVPSCSTASSALTWTSGTGFGCNSITGGGGTGTSGQMAYFSGTNTVSGNVNATISGGILSLGQVNSTLGGLTMFGSTSGSVTLEAKAVAGSSLTFTLPSANPTAAGQALVGGTSGGLSFSSSLGAGAGGTGQTTYTDGQLLVGDSSTNGLDKGTITAGAGISVTNGHGSITIAATSGSMGVSIPQGRLSLATTPVMTADEVAQGTIYYVCYQGNNVPIYNGTTVGSLALPSCQISDTLNSGSVTATGNVYDLYVIDVLVSQTPTPVLCNSAAWQTTTSRGTGTANIHMGPGGYLTNAASLTHCYNGATDEGAITTDEATYVGSFISTAAAQTTFQLRPTAVSGGESCTMGLWNAYNQVLMSCLVQDTAATWSYAPATAWTWRQADTPNGPNSKIVWVDGAGGSVGGSGSTVETSYEIMVTATSTTIAGIGVDLDSVSAIPTSSSVVNASSNKALLFSKEIIVPQQGMHTLYPVESNSSTTNAASFQADSLNGSTIPTNALWAKIPM